MSKLLTSSVCMFTCQCNVLHMLCAPQEDSWRQHVELMEDLNREIKKLTAAQRLLSNTKLGQNAKISVNPLEKRGRHSPAACLFFPPAGIFQPGGDTYLVSWSLQHRGTTFQNKGDRRVQNISSGGTESRWNQEKHQRALTSRCHLSPAALEMSARTRGGSRCSVISSWI